MTAFRIKRLAPTAFLLSIWLISACSSDDGASPEKGLFGDVRSGTWVATEPTQCLTNPWERDWLEQHNNDYDAYPKRQPGELTPEELQIIKDYYDREGVVVFDGTTRPRYEEVCLACSCPEGHTLYLSVRTQDVETMRRLGYREEIPLRSGLTR